ncbi:MAG TPA: toll/interleukin-1 receptor domain-containing protein [Allosphingosinicella sp.]|nr:toll/interleukin-1 receptor domain-containing protein [Allosphingosinicella sp.]
MKVFISWSGVRSRRIAELLYSVLIDVLPDLTPWISHHSIEPGVLWITVLHENLRDSHFGVVCVTPDSVANPWLNFESGALSISLGDKRRVVPFLAGYNDVVLDGPLSTFQAILANKEGATKLLEHICETAGKSEDDTRVALETFYRKYSNFDAAIAEVMRKPRYTQVDENQLVATEINAVRVRAYNLSFDPETGPFDKAIGDFNRALGYMIDIVASNLVRGRPYHYILAPKPWMDYDNWVDEIANQISVLDKSLRGRNAGANLHLVKFSLLYLPAPAEYSIDILNTVDQDVIGYWFQEGPGARIPNQTVLEVRDEKALEGQWKLLEEIADKYGITYTLDNAASRLDEIRHRLQSLRITDTDTSYVEQSDRLKTFMWDRMISD